MFEDAGVETKHPQLMCRNAGRNRAANLTEHLSLDHLGKNLQTHTVPVDRRPGPGCSCATDAPGALEAREHNVVRSLAEGGRVRGSFSRRVTGCSPAMLRRKIFRRRQTGEDARPETVFGPRAGSTQALDAQRFPKGPAVAESRSGAAVALRAPINSARSQRLARYEYGVWNHLLTDLVWCCP